MIFSSSGRYPFFINRSELSFSFKHLTIFTLLFFYYLLLYINNRSLLIVFFSFIFLLLIFFFSLNFSFSKIFLPPIHISTFLFFFFTRKNILSPILSFIPLFSYHHILPLYPFFFPYIIFLFLLLHRRIKTTNNNTTQPPPPLFPLINFHILFIPLSPPSLLFFPPSFFLFFSPLSTFPYSFLPPFFLFSFFFLINQPKIDSNFYNFPHPHLEIFFIFFSLNLKNKKDYTPKSHCTHNTYKL